MTKKIVAHSGSNSDDPHDRESCAVRAIEHAFGFDRAGAKELATQYGRKPNDGMYQSHFKKMVEDFGATLVGVFGTTKPSQYFWSRTPIEKQFKGMSFKTFVDNHKTGTYILFITGHFTVVKNGMVLDSNAYIDGGKSVIAVWKV